MTDLSVTQISRLLCLLSVLKLDSRFVIGREHICHPVIPSISHFFVFGHWLPRSLAMWLQQRTQTTWMAILTNENVSCIIFLIQETFSSFFLVIPRVLSLEIFLRHRNIRYSTAVPWIWHVFLISWLLTWATLSGCWSSLCCPSFILAHSLHNSPLTQPFFSHPHHLLSQTLGDQDWPFAGPSLRHHGGGAAARCLLVYPSHLCELESSMQRLGGGLRWGGTLWRSRLTQIHWWLLAQEGKRGGRWRSSAARGSLLLRARWDPHWEFTGLGLWPLCLPAMSKVHKNKNVSWVSTASVVTGKRSEEDDCCFSYF